MEEHRKAKKVRIDGPRKRDGKIGRVAYMPLSSHSSMFEASFVKGVLQADVMADQGADTVLVSFQMIIRIWEKPGNFHTTRLKPPQVYRKGTGNPRKTCDPIVKMDEFFPSNHTWIQPNTKEHHLEDNKRKPPHFNYR